MKQRKKECFFIKNNINDVHWRDTMLLKKFVNPNGKVLSRSRTGLCSKFQRRVENEIKKARFMGMLPYIDNV